ncbi:hypothetical protein ASZ90_018943 [hydrocarbon metagenome]|uniref:Uncharacterized protein n=1 Tax=hydrocarbon metagenome TaxID=938273 RepID=A0A0W8E4W5_9ZZZZ
MGTKDRIIIVPLLSGEYSGKLLKDMEKLNNCCKKWQVLPSVL